MFGWHTRHKMIFKLECIQFSMLLLMVVVRENCTRVDAQEVVALAYLPDTDNI